MSPDLGEEWAVINKERASSSRAQTDLWSKEHVLSHNKISIRVKKDRRDLYILREQGRQICRFLSVQMLVATCWWQPSCWWQRTQKRHFLMRTMQEMVIAQGQRILLAATETN